MIFLLKILFSIWHFGNAMEWHNLSATSAPGLNQIATSIENATKERKAAERMRDAEWNQFKDKYPKIAKLQLSDSNKQTLIAIAKEYAGKDPSKPGVHAPRRKTSLFRQVYNDMIKDVSIPHKEMMDLFGLTQSTISKNITKIKEERKRKAKEGQQP